MVCSKRIEDDKILQHSYKKNDIWWVPPYKKKLPHTFFVHKLSIKCAKRAHKILRFLYMGPFCIFFAPFLYALCLFFYRVANN